MTIRSKAALFLLALLAGVALAPLILRLDQVQSAVVSRLQRELPFELRLHAIRWHWWPLPSISASDLRVEGNRWQLTATAAEYYPAWMALLGMPGSAGEIVLKQPALRLTEAEREPPAAKPTRLPHLTLLVEDGSFSIPAALLPVPFKTEPLNVTGMNGRIDLSTDEIAVRASAASHFFQKTEVEGRLVPATSAYRFRVKSRGLEIHKVIASLAGGRLLPGEAKVDLDGEVAGVGLAEFKADVTGEFPCFLIRPQEQAALVTCGFADFSVSKSDASVALVLNRLDLKDPQLLLQGKVLRTQQDKAAEPRWEIDLTARDADVDGVREKTLSVLGDVNLVRKVTDIVLGGVAPAVRFRFAGPAAALGRLKAFTIEGRLEHARLLVPKVELDLNEVGGEFAIREGRLSGRDLQARLGKSEGRNGELLLALTGDEKELILDLDLEAELAELPAVLHQTIHSEAFLGEVDRFGSLEGRVKGHLHLGDRLRHPIVEVTVDELKGSGRYARLPWPFKLEGGRLEVMSAGRVGWRGVKAAVGPHRIAESSGAVSWGKDYKKDLRLDVDSFQASLAAAPLHLEINRYPEVRRRLAQALTGLAGKIKVTGGAFHGLLRRPEEWQYGLGIEGEDLAWTSPLVGQPVSTRKVSGSISHQEAVITASDNWFLGQQLAIQGRLDHRQLAHWSGWVEVEGAVKDRLAAWVKQRGWVPPTFFPRIPCFVDGLRIGWGEGDLSLSGGIIAGSRPEALPRVDLDLRKTGKDLTVKRLEVSAADERGFLAFELPAHESAAFELSWRGDLSGKTIDALLESNQLLSGRVAGDCTFRHAPEAPQQTLAAGTLQATDLRLPLPGRQPLVIERLHVNGAGASLDIPLLQLQFAGERTEASGRIATTPEGLALDLQVASPVLSWSTLTSLHRAFSEMQTGGGARTLLAQRVHGRIGFDIAEFRYAPGWAKREEKTTYRWQPLQGAIELQPEERWALGIERSGICGLAMNGTWSSGKGGAGMVHFKSDPQAPPAFEEVMPCLGMKQDLIVGEFDLDATLHGRPGLWTGGEAALRSAHGNIRRLTLLSRVFSVVNLTDLFTASDAPGLVTGGLPYSEMNLEARVADNQLVFEKAVVRGEGLNLFGRGSMDLATFRADLTILIAPFKTMDAILSSVPLLGRIIGGKNATLVTIPVGVEGPVADPAVTVLAPEAVGESLLSLVKETLSLPFTLFSPIFPGGK